MKIVVELTEKEYLGDKVWYVRGNGLKDQKQYVIGVHETDWATAQVGDIVTLWGNECLFDDFLRQTLLPLVSYSEYIESDIRCFNPEKFELITRYSKRVRDVLGMEP